MNTGDGTGDARQIDWNGIAGRNWIEAQVLLDQLFKPLEDLLVEAVPAGSAGRVLDVGCGTGGVTLAAAGRLAAEGHAVGIDISEPMIAAAADRAERHDLRARFIRADAETHPFEPVGFDTLLSRFGVMFFGDSVRAFANLRRAAREGAAMRFLAWRSPEENPFMTAAARAAAPHLPNLPGSETNAPGQFAFAEASRVRRILEESGWAEIDIRPHDAACVLPEAQLEFYFTRLGPVGRVLHEADEGTRARVVEAVRAAFDPFVEGKHVRFVAACWLVTARAPSTECAEQEANAL